MAPFNLMETARSDEVPSTSCTEGEELLRVRDSSTQSRGVGKIAVVAAATGLIAVAGTWWARNERLGNDDTGLAYEYYRYATIGCSNWESIEIGVRASGLTLAQCQALCDADETCTMVNYQKDPCQPGFYVAGGCLLFKGTCATERNECWELDYKVEVTPAATGNVTGTLLANTTGPVTPGQMEAACNQSLTTQTGTPPSSCTAATTRRLEEADGRRLQSLKWELSYKYLNFALDVATAVEDSLKTLAPGSAALDTFSGTFNTAVSNATGGAATCTVTYATEPVLEAGGTTSSPKWEPTPAPPAETTTTF